MTLDKNSKKNFTLVSASEEDDIARTVLAWLNGWTEKPAGAICYGLLPVGLPGMAFSLRQGTYQTRKYLLGGYEAQLRSRVRYRIQPGDSGNARLQADAALNALADWACDKANLPELGGGCTARRVVTDNRAATSDLWENGDEDHTVLLTLIYEKL